MSVHRPGNDTRIETLTAALKKAVEFVTDCKAARWPADQTVNEGELCFNTCDYHAMNDILEAAARALETQP